MHLIGREQKTRESTGQWVPQIKHCSVGVAWPNELNTFVSVQCCRPLCPTLNVSSCMPVTTARSNLTQSVRFAVVLQRNFMEIQKVYFYFFCRCCAVQRMHKYLISLEELFMHEVILVTLWKPVPHGITDICRKISILAGTHYKMLMVQY